MPFSEIDFDTYENLRTVDLSHPDIPGEWRLGQTASWSLWGSRTGDLNPLTAHTAAEFQKLAPMSTQIVFFGINFGGRHNPMDSDDWRNFHANSHAPDGVLKNSFRQAYERAADSGILPAFYMTDVFKLVPTPNARLLDSQIASDLRAGIDHVGRCAAILEEELRICSKGAAPYPLTLVAIGKSAYEWMIGAHGRDPRIREAIDTALGSGAAQSCERMDHYSFGVSSNAQRATQLLPIFRAGMRS